ncbi:MAG: hypothetical protein ACRDFB_06025 [Rhabdochlamydiaceae bacterium]
MSGINALKEKSKKHLETHEKHKMGLGEIFEDQTVGKPDNQKDGKPEVKQTNQLDIQKSTNPVSQTATHPEVQPSSQTLSQQTISPTPHLHGQPATHPVGKMEIQPDVNPDSQTSRQPTIFSTKQPKNQKVPTTKMTVNLREDIHKAFNDLYAHRILRGEAPEKSEMICEAIEWLIKMEEKRTN